jgi:hypothetical protein
MNITEKDEEELVAKVQSLWRAIEKWRLKQRKYPLELNINVPLKTVQKFQPKGCFILFYDEKHNFSETFGLVLPKETLKWAIDYAYTEKATK